jgi:phage shock protein A
MMGFLEVLLRYLALWVVPPLALMVLVLGPARVTRWVKQGWRWLWERRDNPEQILADVVAQHEAHVEALRSALEQAEKTEAEIVRNIQRCQRALPELEAEAQRLTAKGDDLGARAALYKLNLERAALASFEQHLERQRESIAESRRRLYLLELQLRQFEVGRSILLSQLAAAKTLEQQYAIANQFDPFSAVANWSRAEGMVQDKAITARAVERVHADTNDLAPPGAPEVDPIVLEAQLAELKARLHPPNMNSTAETGHPTNNQPLHPPEQPVRREKVEDG